MSVWLSLIFAGIAVLFLIPNGRMHIIETNKPAIGPYYHKRIYTTAKPARKKKRWGK